MEKIIRCYRYAIVPSSVQRFGDRESRLDSAKTLERLSGRTTIRRTRVCQALPGLWNLERYAAQAPNDHNLSASESVPGR